MKIAVLCAALVASGSANAQDQSLADWSGLYAGASISSAKADVQDNYDSTQIFSFGFDGTTAAAQLGYNFQSGAMVYGIEASYAFGSLSGVGECPGTVCLGTGTQPAMEITNSANLRARIGVAKNDLLYFATLGAGFANATVNDPFQGGADSQKHRGVIASVGIDWRLSARMSAGAEYLYGRYNEIPYALITTPDVIGFETQELKLGVKFNF